MRRTKDGKRRSAITSPVANSPSDTVVRKGSRAERITLHLLVFVSGVVLMGLEIAGNRVLAPHFGNSVLV
jgi:hypothetical protein